MSKIRKKAPGSHRGGSIHSRGSTPSPAARTLPPDITKMFTEAAPARPGRDAALADAAAELDADPQFLADHAKGLVVEDVLRALEASGMSQKALSEKMGTSRQYLSKILNEDGRVNFTIDTLAQLAAALNLHLSIRLLPANERLLFLRKKSSARG